MAPLDVVPETELTASWASPPEDVEVALEVNQLMEEPLLGRSRPQKPVPEEEPLMDKTPGSGLARGRQLFGKHENFVVKEVESDNRFIQLTELLGLPVNRTYEVSTAKDGRILVHAVEDSNPIIRQLPAECRPIRFNFYSFDNGKAAHMFTMRRKASFPAGCMAPIEILSEVGEDAKLLGQIRRPQNPCLMGFHFFDEEETPMLDVRASRLGVAQLFGKGPCGPCQSIDFEFFTPESEEKIETTGSLTHEWTGFKNEILDNINTYNLHMKKDSPELLKSMLMATAVFIDMRYFQHALNLRDFILKETVHIQKIHELSLLIRGNPKERKYA